MGLRVVVVAVLLVVGCGDGAHDDAAVESTPGTTASSLAPPSTTSTSPTSVAPWRTSVPAEVMACVPEPAEYVDPHLTSEVQRPVLGVSRLPITATSRIVVGEGRLWFHHTDAPADLFEPATAPAGGATALVSFDPPCRAHLLRRGPELLAMSCHNLRVDGLLAGPCWVTRHDPASGGILATYGPFTDVVDARWAGDEVILRTSTGLEAPDLGWETTGRFATIEAWGTDGAVFQMHEDGSLNRYDVTGGATVRQSLDPNGERVLGVHEEGLLVERRLTEVPPTYELAVWDLVTLEESATRPISGPATLLDTGEVVVQRALVEGTVPEGQPFTTEMSLYDVATSEETLVATFDDYLVHRDTWPTARPQVVVDDALIVGTAVYPLP